MALQEMLDQLKQIDGQLASILANESLTDNQLKEHDELVQKRDALASRIERLRAQEERANHTAKLAAQVATTATQTATVAEMSARTVTQPGNGRLTFAAAPAEVSRVALPAQVKRHKARNFSGVRGGLSAEDRAERFGLFLAANLADNLPGRFGHLKFASDWVQKNMAVVHQSNNATGAQYLIPEEFSQDIIDLREQYGVARRLFRSEPMESDTKVVPRRQSGLTAYFTSESSAITESNKTWDQVRLTAKSLAVLTRYSAELGADSIFSLGDDLAGEIAYAFASKEDDCAFNGDGTSTYGGITGVRAKLSGMAGLVTQATGTTWSALVMADFNKVVGKLPAFADTQMAAWVCHRTFYFEVIEKLIQAAGGTTTYEVKDGERRPRPIFLGYPVEFSQQYPKTTATGSVVATLGDYRLGAAFGDRQKESIAFSEHATIGGENVFERNQIAVRGTERIDINVHDVGTSSDAGPIVGLQTGS